MRLPDRCRLRSLHGQLLWLVSVVSLVTVSALGAITMHSESTTAGDVIRHQAEASVRSLALASASPLLAGQRDRVDEVLLREAAFPGVVEVQLLDARGFVLGRASRGPHQGLAPRLVSAQASSRLPVPATRGAATELELRREPPSVVAWHPVEAGRLIGWARVETRLDTLDALRSQVWWRTLAVGALAVLGSSVLLLGLLREPMRALARARRFAEDLALADGRQLAPAEGGPVETAALVQALNEASTRLNRQRREIDATLSQLQQHRAQLQDRNLQLASIFALSPDGLVSVDATGRVHCVNPAFSHLTGLEAQALIGQPMQVLVQRLAALGTEPLPWQGLEPLFETIDADAMPRRWLLQLSQPRHSVLSVQGRSAQTPAPTPGQDPQRPAGDGTEVTRLLYLRDVSHEAELDRMKSDFLSTAAHELRSPIASIYGFSELMRTRDYPAERRGQMLAKIHRNAGMLIHIINDLLDLSRLEAGRGADFQRAPQDLAALAAQVLADHAPPAGREPPRLLTPSQALPVQVDAGKIARVLANLLGNAYKYSPDGGRVQVRMLHETGVDGLLRRAGFAVEDQGIGMTAEQIARVFDRFYRADPSGTILGTGLGMSLVKEIVELHDGSVSLTSTPGQGSCVTVWLPAALPVVTAEPAMADEAEWMA